MNNNNKSRASLDSLINNNQFVMIVSLLTAILIWFTVAYYIDNKITDVVKNVPVTINVQDSGLARLNLEPVYPNEFQIDVTVNGPRSVIGNLKPEDIQLTAVTSSVNGPGTYNLWLEGFDYQLLGFEIVSLRPSTIEMRFDHMVTKKLNVELEISGLNIPDGYIMDEEYVTPTEVTVTGPATEMGAVERCVARLTMDRPLSQTANFETDLILLDRNGETVESPYFVFDQSAATVTIQVLEKKTIPITFEFINVPAGFDETTLVYTVNPSEIEVAGPSASIGSLNELHLGYVDMRSLTPDMSIYYPAPLPPGFISVENIQDVNVIFDPTGISQKTLNVTDIRLVNVPSSYDVTVTTRTIPSVQLYGPEDAVKDLTSKDVIAEVDINDADIKLGQITVPVNIIVVGDDSCWAYGDYTAVITVRDKS